MVSLEPKVFDLLAHVIQNRDRVVSRDDLIAAVWQGLLFALAMMYFRRLGVTMTAHFLHDVAGFLLFRFLVNRGREAPAVP